MSAPAEAPADPDIAAILRERVEIGRQGTGIVACMLGEPDSGVFAFGRPGTPDERPLDGDTVFEIGSITKVLTALLLTDMVQRGEIALDDPVSRHLPGAVRVPAFAGQPITLLDLATYTSGLPRLPGNMPFGDRSNPYADYTVELLYSFLGDFELPYRPGTHYEYANLGFGLLGCALACRADRSYEDLLVERIGRPLGLDSTRISLTPSMRSRLAQGHDGSLAPVPPWDIPALPGAGAVRSTANDLAVFLGACLGRLDTPLRPALDRLPGIRRPTNMPGIDAALGWFVSADRDGVIARKEGGTGGFATLAGFSPERQRAAIVLSNGRSGGVGDIGLHLIDPVHPLRRQRVQVAADPAALAGYVGTFRLTPSFLIAVRARGDRLFVQATGQNEFEVFREAAHRFFLRAVDAQITFETDADGRATGLVLHQNGRDRHAPREPDVP